MARKKRTKKRRKSYYIRLGRRGHVRRGACGRGKWRRGGNALWKCKGKKKDWRPVKYIRMVLGAYLTRGGRR